MTTSKGAAPQVPATRRPGAEQAAAVGGGLGPGLSRAAVISRLLQEAAQKVHQSTIESRTPQSTTESRAPTPLGPTADFSAPITQGEHRFAPRRSRRTVWIAFAILVALPAIISGVYLFLFASDQYVTEVRFAARGSETSILESVGSTMALSVAMERVQISMIIAEYIEGRSIVEELDQSIGLRKRYSRQDIDYLWRFDANEPVEILLEYWKQRVDVSVDPLSGIIAVSIRAFTPEDAVAIAQAVMSSSERLVNRLSARSREDALRQARQELARAEANLQQKIAAMRQVRDSDRMIDASKAADALTAMIGKLRLELIGLEQEYAVARRSVSANAPQMQVTEARINSMRDQIRKLESQMTGDAGAGNGAPPTLSASMTGFDRAELDRTIAQQQYGAAAVAFERARVELASQETYLATFLQPVLPQVALYPKRVLILSLIVLGCLLLWGGGIGAAVFLRNYLAI